jgi:hypothetical protein
VEEKRKLGKFHDLRFLSFCVSKNCPSKWKGGFPFPAKNGVTESSLIRLSTTTNKTKPNKADTDPWTMVSRALHISQRGQWFLSNGKWARGP